MCYAIANTPYEKEQSRNSPIKPQKSDRWYCSVIALSILTKNAIIGLVVRSPVVFL
ncbi:MAG: hypothetical protein V7K89_04950 [Nostoc sp.]|uniref:hypothetical protein n=1 Tax=Nostoc sp. TaxID=1180 RepID=UPI002FFC2DD4